MRRSAFGLALLISSTTHAATLFHTDFANTAITFKPDAQPSSLSVSAALAPVGTIDEAGSTTPTQGLRLKIADPAKTNDWSAAAVSGSIAIDNHERDLAKLTFGLMLSSSSARPVAIEIESLDGAGHRTGGLAKTIYPAAPNFYQRFAFELSSASPVGEGTFNPLAHSIRFSVSVKASDGEKTSGPIEVAIDNVSLASPAYYVSPNGNDKDDGRTPATAFATPQHAVEAAQPGDIILLGGSTYAPTLKAVSFKRPGTPSEWIVLKNAPGETPVLSTNGWITVGIALGSKEARYDGPALAYLEIRGLTLKGSSFRDASGKPQSPYPKLIGKVVAETNSNGLLVEGRYAKNPPHHLRIADNLITLNAGVGIGVIDADWAYVENNICSDNSWWTCYACSGISFLTGANFDGTAGGYRFLARHNQTFGNECFAEWTASDGAPHKLSDGNGIIIDTLQGSASDKFTKTPPFTGRTLVQGNLSYNNGGSGMHVLKSNLVDMVNNTVDFNSASPTLHYAQMYASYAHDTLLLNNIVVAPDNEKINNTSPYGEKMSSNIVRRNNLYFGGNVKPVMGERDRIADPLFISPSREPDSANFNVRAGSPAIGGGEENPLVPLTDITGRPRVPGKPAPIGAYDASGQ